MNYGQDTALIVVDVQNDFADPEGGLYVKGGEQVVRPIGVEVGDAQNAGSPVVYTQDWHPESTPHFQKDGGIWPSHCVAETWGAELHPELEVEGEAIRKGAGGEDGYSCFSVRDPRTGRTGATGLEQLLRGRGVERVVIAGLATDYCVKATALDADALGFATEVLTEAIRAVDMRPGDGERAIEEMRAAGTSIDGRLSEPD